MDRRYGEKRDTLCRFLSPDPLSFLIGLLNSQPELPQRPGLLTGSNAACIFLTSRFSHGHKRGLYFLPQPGFLTGTSAACIPPATRLSHGNKRGQRRERM